MGIIWLALMTVMVSPSPSSSSLMMLTLFKEARETVVPSISTGSKIATGFTCPVRLVLHSMSRSTVSFRSW